MKLRQAAFVALFAAERVHRAVTPAITSCLLRLDSPGSSSFTPAGASERSLSSRHLLFRLLSRHCQFSFYFREAFNQATKTLSPS